MKFTKDMINFATTNDASKFVEAVNGILNAKAMEAISGMRQEVAQNIIAPQTAAEVETNENV